MKNNLKVYLLLLIKITWKKQSTDSISLLKDDTWMS